MLTSTRRRLSRLFWAALGENLPGFPNWWDRLSPDGQQVMRLASKEARELGHAGLADEHILLALLRHETNPAATLLQAHGLDLETARVTLEWIGPTLGPTTSPAQALETTLGIHLDDVRRRLQDTFGADAVAAAERRVRRRPRWRRGHPHPRPICGFVFAKRSLEMAAENATERGDTAVGPQHLLYGILRNAHDALGTQLSRRTQHQLAALGWNPGRTTPLRLLIERCGLDLSELATEAGRSYPQ